MTTNSAINVPLAIANGGTFATSVASSPVASSFAGYDSNSNLYANSFVRGYNATNANITLTVSSSMLQYFTVANKAWTLPVVSTLVDGQLFVGGTTPTTAIISTFKTSAGTAIASNNGRAVMTATCVNKAAGNSASWSIRYEPEYNPAASFINGLPFFDSSSSFSTTTPILPNNLIFFTSITLNSYGTGLGIALSASVLKLRGSTSANVITTTPIAMTVNSKFIGNSASLITFNLPTVAAVGDFIQIRGRGAGGWKIGQAAGQTVRNAGVASTTGTGGSFSSSNRYDTIQLECVIANTDFVVTGGYSASGYTVV